MRKDNETILKTKRVLNLWLKTLKPHERQMFKFFFKECAWLYISPRHASKRINMESSFLETILEIFIGRRTCVNNATDILHLINLTLSYDYCINLRDKMEIKHVHAMSIYNQKWNEFVLKNEQMIVKHIFKKHEQA